MSALMQVVFQPGRVNGGKSIVFTPRQCYGCGRCIGVCENGAIIAVNGTIEWYRDKCLNCLKCASSYPGYSAYFVALNLVLQYQIMSRTVH